MRITRNKLNNLILESINSQVNESKIGKAFAGLGLAATLATTPGCGHFTNYEPHWEHEGPYSIQEKMDKTWNTHQERGDWDSIEPGVGFCYDCYTRCANNGGGWTVHVIFADKSTGKFILPQECREYLNGRYMPNCNCFENENTTDRINTNGLERLSGNENMTVFEDKTRHHMKKQTIKLKESQLRQMIKEALNELDWKSYKNAANKRLAQGKYANANELSDMAKNRFDDEFNDNYRYDTLGAKLAGKHGKTFDSTFIPTEEPSLQGRNEKGEELFRNNGRYYNSRRGLTTPEKFFKDKQMSDTFNTATQELDNYNNGNYDYTPDKGWHLKESKLINMIKESIKKTLKESVIKSREFLDADENVCYGEDEMSFFAANYLRNEFRRFPNIVQAKACAQEMLQREKQRRAKEISGLRH